MRILLITIFIIITYAFNIYAEEADIAIIEPKNSETQESPTDDSSRIALCEKEIRQLVGRVEVLEHSVHELQKHQQVRANPDSPHMEAAATTALVVNEATNAAPATSDAAQEKREYDTALAALKESHFQEAENMFQSFMQKYPQSTLISNAYFWYAETFYRRGDFDKAAVHYLKGYKQFPKAAKAADSLLKLALSLGELKKTKEACVILGKLEEEFKQRPASSIKRAYDAKMKYGCK